MDKLPLRLITASSLLLAAALAQPAAAQTADVVAGPCLDGSRAQLTADAAVVKAALEAVRTSGFAGLAAHRAELQAVLDHAPTGAQPVETCETRYVVHAGSLPEGILQAGMLAAAERKSGGHRNVTVEGPLPAVSAALYLGSLATEQHDFGRAVAVLRQGLAIAPGNVGLSSELSTALSQSHHQEEALAVADKALANLLIAPKDKALLQRRRGFAFTELRRLDDAEAAYREAAKLDPADPNAPRELTYIAQQRAGAPRGAITATAAASQAGKAPAAAAP